MDDIDAVLSEAAERAFEELGFLMPDLDAPEGEDAGVLGVPGTGSELKGMVVRFRGPVAGALVVRGEDELLETLATNMLGAESAPSLALQLDALGEIANVICGNVLPAVEDPVAVFRLDTPVAESEPLPGVGERVRGSTRLRLDAGAAEVVLLEVGP